MLQIIYINCTNNFFVVHFWDGLLNCEISSFEDDAIHKDSSEMYYGDELEEKERMEVFKPYELHKFFRGILIHLDMCIAN